MVEGAEYRVSVTITLSTNVTFSPVERDRPITDADAYDNFLGYGLSELIESGEYGVTIINRQVERQQ